MLKDLQSLPGICWRGPCPAQHASQIECRGLQILLGSQSLRKRESSRPHWPNLRDKYQGLPALTPGLAFQPEHLTPKSKPSRSTKTATYPLKVLPMEQSRGG